MLQEASVQSMAVRHSDGTTQRVTTLGEGLRVITLPGGLRRGDILSSPLSHEWGPFTGRLASPPYSLAILKKRCCSLAGCTLAGNWLGGRDATSADSGKSDDLKHHERWSRASPLHEDGQYRED